MSATPESTLANPEQLIADLQRQLAERETELAEAREQQTAPRRGQGRWHPGELYPRVGFIITSLVRPAERVVGFYNQRGTAEQWIKEGKGALSWTNGRGCHAGLSPPMLSAFSSMR